ncbi:MAG: hypothetical protein R3A79_23270 [Nannocystaceae bacterium]
MGERAEGVLEDLVEGLRAESEAVGGGGFRLDFAKAREQLAAYQLAEPARVVLLLVEAGHLLRGCAAIDVWLRTSGTEVVFTGVDLDAQALRECFDALFVDDAAGDGAPAQAHRVGRQRLAMAINAGIDLGGAVVVRAVGPSGTAAGTFAADAPPEVTASAAVGEPELRVSLPRSQRAPADRQRALLHDDARFAAVPLRVDGERVDTPPVLLAAEPIVERSGDAPRGRAGWSPSLAREPRAERVLVANGVAVERAALPQAPPGLLAVVDVGGLGRDLSQTKLRRDGAYARRVAALEATCARMAADAPTFAAPSGEGLGLLPYRLLPSLLGAAFGAGGLALGGGFMTVLFMGVAAALVTFEAWRTRAALRRRRTLARGLPALVRVDRAAPTGQRFKDAPEVEVGFTVVDAESAAGAGAGQTGVDRLTVDSDAEVELLRPGMRLFARVSRDDPRVVLLEQR